MRTQKVETKDTALEIGIFGAEPWTNEMRQQIEKRASLHAVDIYGLSEVIGPGVANECIETKDGLHIWEDHFYPEIIDPETGDVLPDGEQGELVFTSLSKEAFPTIRYRTRDLTRLMPGTARSMRRMEKITGRSDDMVIVRGVNMFPSQVEEILVKIPELSPHYQLELYKDGNMDAVRVHAELTGHATPDVSQAAAKALVRKIKDTIGVSVEPVIHKPGEIARSEGKAKRVVDNRS